MNSYLTSCDKANKHWEVRIVAHIEKSGNCQEKAIVTNLRHVQ